LNSNYLRLSHALNDVVGLDRRSMRSILRAGPDYQLSESGRSSLARGLLGGRGKPCAGIKDIYEKTKERLRAVLSTSSESH